MKPTYKPAFILLGGERNHVIFKISFASEGHHVLTHPAASILPFPVPQFMLPSAEINPPTFYMAAFNLNQSLWEQGCGRASAVDREEVG